MTIARTKAWKTLRGVFIDDEFLDEFASCECTKFGVVDYRPVDRSRSISTVDKDEPEDSPT